MQVDGRVQFFRKRCQRSGGGSPGGATALDYTVAVTTDRAGQALIYQAAREVQGDKCPPALIETDAAHQIGPSDSCHQVGASHHDPCQYQPGRLHGNIGLGQCFPVNIAYGKPEQE